MNVVVYENDKSEVKRGEMPAEHDTSNVERLARFIGEKNSRREITNALISAAEILVHEDHQGLKKSQVLIGNVTAGLHVSSFGEKVG